MVYPNRVTVFIIDYNRPEETKRAAESIKQQTYTNVEVVVWDNTYDNKGIVIPTNEAVLSSDSEYTLLLDNDAYLTNPRFIELCVYAMEYLPRRARPVP
jgi:glycosyltransferase involved in cell wall biosynthesis